jgi:NAD(P)-dependent dehydrogenase (short-subunit alcohol dehydrogenase family)
VMGLLDGKVAIVTGGGRGLGRAHCLALAAHGAAVVVNDPGAGLHGESTAETPAEAVAAEITAAGGRALADHSSVTDWADTEKLIARAATEFGRLDVVVNNAGILRVHGSRVQRLQGWQAAGEYRSKSGGAVEPAELVTGLPGVYGTAPAGRLPDPAVPGA